VSAVQAIFAGHPYRLAAAAALGLAGAALAWYLGSPLFLTSYVEEALPAAALPTPGPTFGTAPPSAAEPAPGQASVLARGELGFVDSLHNGKGEVRVIQVGSRRFVRFESVAITNAPDIHIYLSKDTGGRYVEANTVYLGPMKATHGSFNYEIPAAVDLSQYKSVVVWCRAFTTLITWADVR
jgi:hypothetical protein